MKDNYGGVAWTKHALERLAEREIKQGDAWVTFRRPDGSRFSKDKKAWIFHKVFPYKNSKGKNLLNEIEVVAVKNKSKEWVIISVWARRKKGKVIEKKSLLSAVFDYIFAKK